MCRVLGVSTSGHYAWQSRQTSQRKRRDEVLSRRIEQIHREARKTYGAFRIHAEMQEQGEQVGRKRVARLMGGSSLVGVSRRKSFQTTRRDPRVVRRGPASRCFSYRCGRSGFPVPYGWLIIGRSATSRNRLPSCSRSTTARTLSGSVTLSRDRFVYAVANSDTTRVSPGGSSSFMVRSAG